MKKLFLILAISLTGIFAYAQKKSTTDVPAAVTSKFTSLYPYSKAEDWKKGKDNYETKFTDKDKKMCISIDPNGNVIKTTTTINTSELPKSVNDYVAKNYANEKIVVAEKTVDADGKIKYEAEVKTKRLCFDSDGNFVKSEKCKSKV
jgi:biopolymer transport protein ExbD